MNKRQRRTDTEWHLLEAVAAHLKGAGVFDLRVPAAWMPQSSLHGRIYGVPQIEYTGEQTIK